MNDKRFKPKIEEEVNELLLKAQHKLKFHYNRNLKSRLFDFKSPLGLHYYMQYAHITGRRPI